MTTPRSSSACRIMPSFPRYLYEISLSPRAAGQGCWVAPMPPWVCQQWDNNKLGTV